MSINQKPDEMDIVVANFAEANNDPLDTALNTNINQALQRNVFSEQTILSRVIFVKDFLIFYLTNTKVKTPKNCLTPI